ncbi:hypothetical protein NQ095_07200 [Rossellomorea sp. SC111]|uniref:hypothetical protein n=1 Tax=Rossellomorea sp. SC111 TaxID=2968985 RepID=UPI00215AD72B|nr:hypothetical protein [Rossellomorea sp. SC111]MCR8848183.1 hypothetical protein [Rossellomorea sp. SC111]
MIVKIPMYSMQDFVADMDPDDVDEERINHLLPLVEEVRGMDVTQKNEDGPVKELNEWLGK